MKKVLWLFFSVFVFISCNDDLNSVSLLQEGQEDCVVLRERDPNYPWNLVKTKSSFERMTHTRAVVSFKNYIGRSFKCNGIP